MRKDFKEIWFSVNNIFDFVFILYLKEFFIL